jgi:hypothetical protein
MATLTQLHPTWITDRLPTEDDGSIYGNVLIPRIPGAIPTDLISTSWQHWQCVIPGQPWHPWIGRQ